jgi:hypothetical protein
MALIPKPFRDFKKGPPRRNLRDEVLAQWRGVDVGVLEKSRVSARKAGDLMPRVLADLRMDRRQGEAELVKVWNNLLSPDVTAHAQPVGLNKGTLFVNVDNSVWLDEIVRYRRKEILARLQFSFGREMITKISFRLG